MNYITPTTIILLTILISGIVFYITDKRKQKISKPNDSEFYDVAAQVEDCIKIGERFNRIHAIKSSQMLTDLNKMATCKEHKRTTEQLTIFWRSKFKHLFKS